MLRTVWVWVKGMEIRLGKCEIMKNKEIRIIQELGSTNFHKVFANEYPLIPEQIFVDTEWEIAIFQFPDYLKNDENRPFLKPFHAFFAASAPELFIKPCQAEEVYNYYPILGVPCGFHFDDVIHSIPKPFGQEFQTNWAGDSIWNETATWGIHHSQYFWVLILAYSKEAEGFFEQYLKNHPDRIEVEEFSRQLDREMHLRPVEELRWYQEGLAAQGLYLPYD
jgi:hypothetical protein